MTGPGHKELEVLTSTCCQAVTADQGADETSEDRVRLHERPSIDVHPVERGNEGATLVAPPDDDGNRIRLYTSSDTDLALVRERRGKANRLGFAVQLCLLRYPGLALSAERAIDEGLIRWVVETLWLDAATWTEYAVRDTTRRQHRSQLMAYLGTPAPRTTRSPMPPSTVMGSGSPPSRRACRLPRSR